MQKMEPMIENTNELITVEKDEFGKYARYFDSDYNLRLLIIAALEGKQGDLWLDDKDEPELILFATQFFVGIYGDPNHHLAESLLEQIPIHKYLLAPEAWYERIMQYHKRRVIVKKDARFRFSADSLDAVYLKQLREKYEAKYDYAEFDIGLLKAEDEISEYLWEAFGLFFENPAELLEHGFAYVARDKEGKILSIAGVPHIPHNKEYEVQIVTEPTARGKGLGMLVSIDLLIHSLEQGYVPHWDAATPLSADIAEKLGYSGRTAYPVYLRSILLVMILRASKIPKAIIWTLRKLNVIKD